MVFEVWMEGASGAGALFGDPSDSDRQEFLDAGLVHERTLEATTEEEAKKEFIEWAQTQCDDQARVERVDFAKLREAV